MRRGIINYRGLKLTMAIIMILTFVVALIIISTNQKNNMNSRGVWETNIVKISELKIEDMKLKEYTASGTFTKSIEIDKYDEYVDFLLSVEAVPVNSTLINGTSTLLVIQLKENQEINVLFMAPYIVVNNKYSFKMKNYDSISDNYNDLFSQL